MARIGGAEPGKQALVSGLFTRIAYALTKRKVGRVVKPVQIWASYEAALGRCADGAVDGREPSCGCCAKGLGAVAGGYVGWLSFLN